MEFTNVSKLLGDNKSILNLIYNMDNMEDGDIPFIISESLKIISDWSYMYGAMRDVDRVAICNMIWIYFNSCYQYFIEPLGLDKLLEYGEIEVYQIEAFSGLRYATKKEVEQGVKGLIPKNVYPLGDGGDKEYKYLCLLQWSLEGKKYFFRKAGYKLDYNSDGSVNNSFWEMISMCAPQLMEMMTWIRDPSHMEKSVKILKRWKKAGGFKYAASQKDEITESISVKQLLYNVRTTFPTNSSVPEYRKALAQAISNYKKGTVLSPYEISKMRETYDRYALDPNNRGNAGGRKESDELKELCEKIKAGKKEGLINKNHFAFRIITTLTNGGFKRCSPKQYSYLEDAVKVIEKNKLDRLEKSDLSADILSEDEIDETLNAVEDTSIEDELASMGQTLML